jgi:hypothetical protein
MTDSKEREGFTKKLKKKNKTILADPFIFRYH